MGTKCISEVFYMIKQYRQVYLFWGFIHLPFLFLIKQEMIGGNESCTAGPVSMSYLTCLTYILGEWTGVEHIEDYLSYAVYLLWVLYPLAVVFLLPGVIIILFYTSILLLHIYKRKNELKEAYSNDFWDGAKLMLATLWDGHGRIWHGKWNLTFH